MPARIGVARGPRKGGRLESARNRFSQLLAAIRRISGSLDLDTVLREVVEIARALTASRRRGILTVDKAGQLQDLIISGITPDEHRRLTDWPDGPRLFEHLRDLPGPLRLNDLPGYLGVLVVNARTGEAVSLNQEARRIVERLGAPGRPIEELLKVATCRRADGRMIALDELPLARQLEAPETVRAEEIVLSVPDGRSVRTLINATAIHASDGVESLVVTMQDLAPLDELERLRTEFLAMVSHELRAPLTSIIGSVTTLLRASPSRVS